MLNALKQRLLQQADNTRQNFRLLILGFVGFLLGGALILGSEFMLLQSVFQEALAGLGLILMGGGIILAALGYISLSILRLFRYFNDESGND